MSGAEGETALGNSQAKGPWGKWYSGKQADADVWPPHRRCKPGACRVNLSGFEGQRRALDSGTLNPRRVNPNQSGVPCG